MTQADEKVSLQQAFDEELSKLFCMFVINLETQAEAEARKEYERGRMFALRAFKIANEIAGKS